MLLIMKYSLSWCKKRTRKETGEDCVFTCVFECKIGAVKKKGGGGGWVVLITYYTGALTKPLDWISRLTKAVAVASSSPCLVFSSTASISLCLRWYESLRSSDLSLFLHLSLPHFPFIPSNQIKKLMRDRFFTNCPRNVYHWWNYNVGPVVLFISQLGEVLLDLMGSRHTEYI